MRSRCVGAAPLFQHSMARLWPLEAVLRTASRLPTRRFAACEGLDEQCTARRPTIRMADESLRAVGDATPTPPRCTRASSSISTYQHRAFRPSGSSPWSSRFSGGFPSCSSNQRVEWEARDVRMRVGNPNSTGGMILGKPNMGGELARGQSHCCGVVHRQEARLA
jgi:hypothetical protein